MLKNYLKIALRNLRRYRSYSIINIAGLAIGISCFILISLYIFDEMSYDRFNDKADRIYRISYESPGSGQTRTPHPMAQTMVSDFPEVEQAVTMSPIWGPGLTWAEMPVQYKDERFYEKRFFSADTTFFKVFTIKTIAGDANKAIHEVGTLIITESTAQKYFGDENPIGKTLKIDDKYDMVVRSVIQDIPENSHFHFDFLISYITLKPLETGDYYTWKDFGHYNYIVLKKGVDYKKVEEKIPDWSKKHIDYSGANSDVDLSQYLKLQPLTDIYLKSHLRWELEPNGNISEIYIFGASAILILLIACINFMNLSTARSLRRAKEIGVRKSIGAGKKNLIVQFLAESISLSIISSCIAVVLVEIVIPVFNAYSGKHLGMSLNNSGLYFLLATLLTLIVGIIAGSYPAFFLSSFKPVEVLKGKIKSGKGGASIRQSLIVFQFAVSIFLIASTLIIYSQLDYFRNKDLGFNKEQSVIVPLKSEETIGSFKQMKNSLLSNQNIAGVTGTTNIPGGQFDNEPVKWKMQESPIDFSEIWVDEDFFKVMNIPVINGRGFSKQYGMDLVNSVMINEAASDKFKWDTPIGKELTWYKNSQALHADIIGEVKDFNYRPLHETVHPLLIMYKQDGFKNMIVKIKPGHIHEGIAAIKNTFKEFSHKDAFEYQFMDSFFGKAYKNDERLGMIFILFSLLSIFIASLGLFGLAAFMAEQKTKEIGIRKVLGASVSGIVILMSKQFTKWVLVANIIAWPLAYFVMRNWLDDFAYKIEIDWWMFALAGGIALVIALLTISIQAVKAATANPVKSLRYE